MCNVCDWFPHHVHSCAYSSFPPLHFEEVRTNVPDFSVCILVRFLLTHVPL
jgi:hypothetical protein